jgi:hypothetical protein
MSSVSIMVVLCFPSNIAIVSLALDSGNEGNWIFVQYKILQVVMFFFFVADGLIES